VQSYWCLRNLTIINKVGANSGMPKAICYTIKFIVIRSSSPTTSILLDCLVIIYRENFVNNIALKHPAVPINHLILRNTQNTVFNVQGGSNMTGTVLCVNKPHKSRSYLNHLAASQDIRQITI
jgi:hypothetical protein